MRIFRGKCHYGRELPELPFGVRELVTRGIIVVQRKLRGALECDLFGEAAAKAIIEGLKADRPFLVSRFGTGEMEAVIRGFDIASSGNVVQKSLRLLLGNIGPFWWDNSIKAGLNNNAGFFPPTGEALQRFSNLVVDDAKQIDVLGIFPEMPARFQKAVLPQSKIIPLADLSPFWNEHPWTRYLAGKKVLVIHSMPDTIKSQYAKRGMIFKDESLLPEFDLSVYGSVNSAMGIKTEFPDWFAALKKMEEDIAKIDFDVALIGCGAYGMSLGAFIKRELGRKALHLGGMTQMLFGIKGRRWEQDRRYDVLYTDAWTRPLPHEVPAGIDRVEGGCYW